MAEIAGLAASVVAITGAAATALKMSRHLVRLSEQLETAADDIDGFVLNLRGFHTALEFGLRTLERCCAKLKASDSDIYHYLEEFEVFEELAKKSGRTGTLIKRAWHSISKAQSKFTLVRNAKWVFIRRPQLEALHPEMESLKTELSVILHAITLEILQDSLEGVAPEILQEKLKEIEDLKAQIKAQVKTIAFLQASEERRMKRDAKKTEVQRPSQNASYRLQDVLISLGTSMAHSGRVPGSHDSPSSSTSSYTRRTSYTTSAYTDTSRITPTTSPENSIHNPQPSNSTSTPGPIALPRPRRLSVGNQVRESRRYVHQTPAKPPEAHIPALRHKKREITDAVKDSEAPPVVVAQAGPSRVNQEDYTSVRPLSDYLLYFDQKTIQSVTGYIRNGKELVPTTALLDPEFDQNFISDQYAARLGLNIEPHSCNDNGGNHEVTIEFPNGDKKKSSGIVVFEWSAGISSHKPPFKVKCLAYEHGVRNLVLGKPFVERRQHYWNEGEDKDAGNE